jgi:hypothetical protein
MMMGTSRALLRPEEMNNESFSSDTPEADNPERRNSVQAFSLMRLLIKALAFVIIAAKVSSEITPFLIVHTRTRAVSAA